MTKEEFNKLWKDSTKEDILNQYYYDYKELQRTNNIINDLENSIVGKINVLYQVRGQSNAIQELRILLRQLRELKGDSSNDNNGNI